LYYTGGKETARKKVVLTVDEIKEVLHHHHSNAMGGHSGVNATLFKVSSYYYWNGMKEDIQEYVSCYYLNRILYSYLLYKVQCFIEISNTDKSTNLTCD
jgi:hypothetical protein